MTDTIAVMGLAFVNLAHDWSKAIDFDTTGAGRKGPLA